MATNNDDCLTAVELSERLKVRPSTILDWQRSGRIPALRITNKVLRFNLADVLAALNRSNAGEGVSL
jgi:excisionase family DNA binding protein